MIPKTPQARIPVELDYPGAARQVKLSGTKPPNIEATYEQAADGITFELSGKILTVIGLRPDTSVMYSGEDGFEAITTVTIAAGNGYPEMTAELVFYGFNHKYDSDPSPVDETLQP